MKGFFLFQILVLIALSIVCSGQEIKQTPLLSEFTQHQMNNHVELSPEDLVKIDEIHLIDQEIEDSINKAEEVVESLHNRIEKKERILSNDEMINALKSSVTQLHDDIETSLTKTLPKQVKITKNLIGEAVLDELSDEIKDDFYFHAEGDNTINQEKKKKEIQEIIKVEKTWMREARNKLQSMNLQPQKKYQKQAADNQKRREANLNKQKQSITKIEQIFNQRLKANPINQTILISEIQMADNKVSVKNQPNFLQETIDEIFYHSDKKDEQDTIELTQENQYQIIEDDGRRIQQLKKENSDEQSSYDLEQEINNLLEVGDQLHERFVEESVYLDNLLNSQQNSENLTILLKDKQNEADLERHKQPEDKYQQNQEEKQEIQKLVEEKVIQENEETSSFFKQMAFIIVIVLITFFMFFGIQFDLFQFFSQRRRAKHQYYKDNEEVQQTLLN